MPAETQICLVAGCSSADRGGCSQICTPVAPSRWQCGCLPGYQLHQDGKRCIATGKSYYSKADGGDRLTNTEKLFLNVWNSLPVLCFWSHFKKYKTKLYCGHKVPCSYSSGPPPYLVVANLVDVRRINPDGTEDQTLVKEPRGTILALDYDPVQNYVKPLSFFIAVMLHICKADVLMVY